MPYETIILERKGHTLLLTLNRPEALNSYNFEMHRDLNNAWDEINEDDDIWSVVVAGAGRAFCTGADMKERSRGQAQGGYTGRRGDPPSDRIGEFKADLSRYTGLPQPGWGYPAKPMIAAIHGICCGDGVGWLFLTDFAICSDDATFFDPHVNVGAHPSSISFIHSACARPMALAIQLLGLPYRLNAQRAHELGLVTEVVPRGDLMERALGIAEDINKSPEARQAFLSTKALYWATSQMRFGEARQWVWPFESEMRLLQPKA